LPCRVNAFRLEKTLDELDWDILVLRVCNLALSGPDRFRELNRIADEIAREYSGRATYSAPTETENYIVLVNPSVEPRPGRLSLRVGGVEYIIELAARDVHPCEVRESIRRILYRVTEEEFTKHRMWPAGRHKYCRAIPETLDDAPGYKLYRGVFFRYDILDDGTILLVLDPVVRMASEDTLSETISKLGREKALRVLKGRYVIMEVMDWERSRSTFRLRKISNVYLDETAGGSKVVSWGGEKITVKEYYIKRGAPWFVENVKDDEPLFQVIGNPHHFLTSKAHLTISFSELGREERQILKSYIYLTAEQRAELTKEFLMLINGAKDPCLGRICFKDDFLAPQYCDVLPPPRLKFGGSEEENPPDAPPLLSNISSKEYRSFFIEKLRFGPCKSVSFRRDDRLAIVYPSDLSEELVRRHYERPIRREATRTFGVKLPRHTYYWQYEDKGTIEDAIKNVRQNYEEYKDYVAGALVILRTARKDRLYVPFKNLFSDVATQMASLEIMPLRLRRRKDIYWNAIRNLTSGLLTKMGVRPWLLADQLTADLYVGIDTMPGTVAVLVAVGPRGEYLAETWSPIKGRKIPEDKMVTMMEELLAKASQKGFKLPDKPVMVFHRDGDLYPSERRGIASAGRLLGAKVVAISIRKTVPYRIYSEASPSGVLEACWIGSYAKLDEHRALISGSGRPLLRQGMARPLLIEIVYSDVEDYTIMNAVSDVYALSFTHWATLTAKIKEPVTIRYADDFAYLIHAGVKEEIVGPPL